MEPIDVRATKEMKNFKVKIVDMGNACYTHKKPNLIQTRNYRGPEVIIRGAFDETADIWSLGCTVFELVTGRLLFRPRKTEKFSKNQDHLAQIIELIGPCTNREFLFSGKKSAVSISLFHSLPTEIL